MRRAQRRIGVVGAVALPLVLVGSVHAAPPKKERPPETAKTPETTKTAKTPETTKTAKTPDASASWVADELRILRSDLESLRQLPEASVATDLAALRAEMSRLAAAQAELERRIGATPASVAPRIPPEPESGGGVTSALIFLTLGAALGWVGSRLTQRWRDRRLRIRV